MANGGGAAPDVSAAAYSRAAHIGFRGRHRPLDDRIPSSSLLLRPQDEVDRQRAIAELWHWRSRIEELIDEDCGILDKASAFQTVGA